MTGRGAIAVWFLVSIVGAHALAYVIVRVLPDPAFIALGIGSAQQGARAAFESENKPRTYVQIVSDLAHGNLGTTLDGVPVNQEVSVAFAASVPRFFVAATIVGSVVMILAIMPPATLGRFRYAASLFSFFPPFLAPFVGLGILVSSNAVFSFASWWGSWLLCALSLAFPSAALAGAQAAEIMDRNLKQPFAVTIRAMGGSRTAQRARLLNNLVMEMTPTFEKLVTGLLTTSLFAEPIFGESGIGTTTLRAIRRTDIDLILALILLFALVVNVARLVSFLVRRSYGLEL